MLGEEDYFTDYKIGRAYTKFDFNCFIVFETTGSYNKAVRLLNESGIPFGTLGSQHRKVFIRSSDRKVAQNALDTFGDGEDIANEKTRPAE